MYQPFLISNFKTAKSIGLEPWLSPEDAFPTLINMIVNKGVLGKRLGFSPFATMKHDSTVQTATPIMGIFNYRKLNGNIKLLICDNKRVNLYYAVDGTMTDIAGSDIFTGDNDNFFSFRNWQGVGYMVNYKDQIYQYSGSGDVAVFNYQVNSTDLKTNHLDTCKFLFVKDDRLIFLSTVEFGDSYPYRCRYTPVLQTDGTAAGAGYVDCPEYDRIITAGMIGKDIAVRTTKALWRIKSTGNSDIPLRWDRIRSVEFAKSPYSGIEFNDGFSWIGSGHIQFYDGFKVKSIGIDKIRDIIDDFEATKLRYSYAYNQEDSDHVYFTYVNNGSSIPDRILDYNILENNWTVHKSAQSFFVHCIGGFTGQKVPTMTDLDLVHHGDTDALTSDMDVAAVDVLGDPFPYTLIGCRNSQVYKWLDGEYDGTNDANGNIEIDARSSRWNPFTKNGRKVACEKIGFLVDNDEDASFLVSVYKNSRSTTPYVTKTISCDSADDDADKFWVWIFCNGEVGDFHRLKISHTEKGNVPKIHAFKPYFEAAGRLDE